MNKIEGLARRFIAHNEGKTAKEQAISAPFLMSSNAREIGAFRGPVDRLESFLFSFAGEALVSTAHRINMVLWLLDPDSHWRLGAGARWSGRQMRLKPRVYAFDYTSVIDVDPRIWYHVKDRHIQPVDAYLITSDCFGAPFLAFGLQDAETILNAQDWGDDMPPIELQMMTDRYGSDLVRWDSPDGPLIVGERIA